MKYAFIIGSNAFVVPNGVISIKDGEHSREIIRIKSIYQAHQPGSHLMVDLDIEDHHGMRIKITNNVAENYSAYVLKTESNSLKILNPDGNIFINILQMDEDSAMALEHNIVAELEVNMPVTAIRIFGDFKAGDLNISAENEKLFVNDNGYGTSALAGNKLQFTTEGVVL